MRNYERNVENLTLMMIFKSLVITELKTPLSHWATLRDIQAAKCSV